MFYCCLHLYTWLVSRILITVSSTVAGYCTEWRQTFSSSTEWRQTFSFNDVDISLRVYNYQTQYSFKMVEKGILEISDKP